MSECGCFLGMDEAGYGPNLGPLLLTVTSWTTPCPPAEFNFYSELSSVVSSEGHDQGTKLHLADSKQVFVGKHGFASLERSALALLSVAGARVNSLHQLWNTLHGETVHPSETLAPWYLDDMALPVAADPRQIEELSGRLADCMQQIGLRLRSVRGDVVVEERFNQLSLAEGSNKSQALSRLAFDLLKQVWQRHEPTVTLFVGDKHGGRNRYDEFLAAIVDHEFIHRLEEGPELSRYRVARTELRFQVKGEQHLPVACASIVAKYLRELTMDQLNAFWKKHCPDLRPTRGYPLDARRFFQSVEPLSQQLGIERARLWRER